MKKYLPIVLTSSTVFLFFFLLFSSVENSKAATATHIVISEVQIEGPDSSTSADFVEIYNPTNSEVELGDMRLVKRTADATEDTNIISFTAEHAIPAHGYFLWCHNSIADALDCDASTTGSVSNNNSVGIRMEPANTGTLVDSVTIGTVTNPLGEGTAISEAPQDGASIERKANSASTVASMTSGADVNAGNGEDTDNNTNDFITRASSQAQNSASATENSGSNPSPTTEPTPTDSPAPTITTTPSATPTISISPTVSPTNVPSPTTTITATPTVSPTTTPSITPTPTVKPPFVFPVLQVVCTPKIISIKIFGTTYNFEFPSCKVVRVN